MAKRSGTAVVVGRFQPMHNGHLTAIEGVAHAHGRMIIIVGSAQYKRTLDNPLSASERKRMIAGCLERRGMLKKATIVLLRDERDNAKWTRKVRLVAGAGKNVVVYSNNPLVRRLLRPYYRLASLVSGIELDSTKVRKAIRQGRDWKAMVPPEVAEFLEKNDLVKVISGSAS